jgi:antitoxin ParD1/3/4
MMACANFHSGDLMPDVHLDPHFEAFIARKVDEGRYQNASEVVLAGLRLLEDAELDHIMRANWIATEIDAAFEQESDSRPATAVFEELERHHAQKAET